MGFFSDLCSDAWDYFTEHPVQSTFFAVATVATGGAVSALAPSVLGALGGGSLASGLAAAAGGVTGGAVGGSGLATGVASVAGVVAKRTVQAKTAQALGALAAAKLSESMLDNALCDKVTPRVGSILCCDLAMVAEHSGIYLGKNKIAHLNGSGEVEIVSSRQFLKRLGGLNPAVSIYVSCNDEGAVGSLSAANRARSKVGGTRDYSVILDNCHQFTSGCITGNFENADNFLWMLKHSAEESLNVTTWRVWDLSD